MSDRGRINGSRCLTKIGNAHQEYHGYDHRRRHAPDADRVDDPQLQVRQPDREQHPDPGLERQDLRYYGLVLESRQCADNGDGKHVEVEEQPPRRHRKAEETRPLAGVHSLARADGAAQLPDDSEFVEREVERDEDPGQRERGHDHPLGHFGAAAGLVLAAPAGAAVLATESTTRLSASYDCIPAYSLLPMTKLGVEFTPRRKPSARLALMRD